nr:hypothetical protein Iba_chr09eCG0090 [Ipomoea batatas]
MLPASTKNRKAHYSCSNENRPKCVCLFSMCNKRSCMPFPPSLTRKAISVRYSSFFMSAILPSAEANSASLTTFSFETVVEALRGKQETVLPAGTGTASFTAMGEGLPPVRQSVAVACVRREASTSTALRDKQRRRGRNLPGSIIPDSPGSHKFKSQ